MNVMTRRPSPVEIDHRAAVQDMRPLDAVDYLLDVIEAIAPPASHTAQWDFDGVHLTRSQKKILRAIAAGRGAIVTRDQVYAALVADRRECDWPTYKSVEVQLCFMRRRLAGSPVRIETVFGQGYRIAAPVGTVWPWERAQ